MPALMYRLKYLCVVNFLTLFSELLQSLTFAFQVHVFRRKVTFMGHALYMWLDMRLQDQISWAYELISSHCLYRMWDFFSPSLCEWEPSYKLLPQSTRTTYSFYLLTFSSEHNIRYSYPSWNRVECFKLQDSYSYKNPATSSVLQKVFT